MSFDLGGHAAKLGDRYEGRWIVKQLLRLLNEQLQSVKIEAIGDDEPGVDLWVVRRDKVREAQQCKAHNRSKATWSISDLAARGVLQHVKAQLERDSSYEFTFVSSVPAIELQELAERARESSGDPETFVRHHVQGGPQRRQLAFSAYCKQLGFDADSDHGRTRACDLLRRTFTHQIPDSSQSKEDLRGFAKVLVAAEPDVVIAALADFAKDNPRKPIVALDVRLHLQSLGLQLRQLICDERVATTIESLREDFIESIEPKLAGRQLIPRSEITDLSSLISSDKSPSVVMLHGSAGNGKSGVLYGLTRLLDDASVPYIAIRLDRKLPRGGTREFGKAIGLPDSPALCLGELAIDRPAVLILDQLDALRWTNSHSPEGIEVCKTLVREVKGLREAGRRITAVLSCRSFDLRHDPQIKDWLGPGSRGAVHQVEVGRLSTEAVRRAVETLGVDLSRLTDRRLTLLSCVQNLAMWIDIVQSERRSPDFDSATQLMRAFWRTRRQLLEAAGIESGERDAVLADVVNHMEQTASLNAPTRLLDRHERLSTELQTLGIVVISGKSVTFGHQSYLDFLIADRVVGCGASPDSVLTWLGDESQQTLFRREQLRQVLFLLADDDPTTFRGIAQRLLDDPDVRFHIKQLVLEAIGQLVPDTPFIDFALGLLQYERWRDHVLAYVFAGNADYIDACSKLGVIREWLTSGNPDLENRAFWLLELVADRCDDTLAANFESVVNRGTNYVLRVNNSLSRSRIAEEGDRLFQVRLQCARVAPPEYVDWAKIAGQRPDRALRLLAAMYEGYGDSLASGSDTPVSLRIEQADHTRALLAASARLPRLAWRLLAPQFVRLSRWRHKSRQQEGAGIASYHADILFRGVAGLLSSLLISAARAMGRRRPNLVQRIIDAHSDSKSAAMQRILVTASAALPRSYADRALTWLIANPLRIRCGSRRKRPSWHPAQQLIQRMSPHCSDTVFRTVEQFLLRYRDPREKKMAAFWLHARQEGDFQGQFGAAQYQLLSALCPRRRSRETTGWIGCLQHKFASISRNYFARRAGRGGLVHSPLNPRRLDHLSDKAWLAIVSNTALPRRGGPWRDTSDGLSESSSEMFARDLRIAANRNPERFVRLGTKIPQRAAPEYLASILDAARRQQCPDEIPEGERDAWRPAPCDAVEALLKVVPIESETEQAAAFCWALCERQDITCSEPILSRLLSFARHSDPRPDELNVYCDRRANACSVRELEANAFNCVRGIAARALSLLLSRDHAILAQLRPTILNLLTDDHAAVRVAALGLCRSIWSVDRSLAVDWLIKATEADERVGACHDAGDFYNVSFPSYAERLTELICRMVESSYGEVASAGAGQVAARNVFFGLFTNELSQCCFGSVAQRKGVAHVAAQLVPDSKYALQCRSLAARFFEDPEKEVRLELSRMLHSEELLRQPGADRFLCDYAKSQAFRDDPRRLMYLLSRYGGALSDLAELIRTLGVEIASKVAERSRDPADHTFWAANDYSAVLLRLYEEAGRSDQTQLRGECLNLWDALLEQRVGTAVALTRDRDIQH